jgi:hypothetical protein
VTSLLGWQVLLMAMDAYWLNLCAKHKREIEAL